MSNYVVCTVGNRTAPKSWGRGRSKMVVVLFFDPQPQLFFDPKPQLFFDPQPQ